MAARTAKNPARKPKSSLRRRRLIFTILGGVSLWAVFAFLEQSGSIGEKRAELQELERRLGEVRTENEAYRSEVTRLQDPEYIEQKVRKDFGMTRPGDKVFGTPAQ